MASHLQKGGEEVNIKGPNSSTSPDASDVTEKEATAQSTPSRSNTGTQEVEDVSIKTDAISNGSVKEVVAPIQNKPDEKISETTYTEKKDLEVMEKSAPSPPELRVIGAEECISTKTNGSHRCCTEECKINHRRSTDDNVLKCENEELAVTVKESCPIDVKVDSTSLDGAIQEDISAHQASFDSLGGHACSMTTNSSPDDCSMIEKQCSSGYVRSANERKRELDNSLIHATKFATDESEKMASVTTEHSVPDQLSPMWVDNDTVMAQSKDPQPKSRGEPPTYSKVCSEESGGGNVKKKACSEESSSGTVKKKDCSEEAGSGTVKKKDCSEEAGGDTVKKKDCSEEAGGGTVKKKDCSEEAGGGTVKKKDCSEEAGGGTVKKKGKEQESGVKKLPTSWLKSALSLGLDHYWLMSVVILATCAKADDAIPLPKHLECHNHAHNESSVICSCTTMGIVSLHDWDINWTTNCGHLRFTPSSDKLTCSSTGATIDGHVNIISDPPSFSSVLSIMIQVAYFSGRVSCSVIHGNGIRESIENFTLSGPMVRCDSVSLSDGMLTIEYSDISESLPMNRLTVKLTHAHENRTVDVIANNSTVTVPGDLDPGWYDVDLKAGNNVGSFLARCQNRVYHPGGIINLTTIGSEESTTHSTNRANRAVTEYAPPAAIVFLSAVGVFTFM